MTKTARAWQISPPTLASRPLPSRASSTVSGRSPLTPRRKVLTAIDELGYDRPSPERTPDTPTIGIVLPELTNPIFASFRPSPPGGGIPGPAASR